MNDIKLVQLKHLGFNFTDKKYLPEGQDEYHIRYRQAVQRNYRYLTSDEIGILKSLGNTADNWNNIRVTDNFSPNRVKNNKFYGLNRIGDIDDVFLDFHDLHQPAGIYDSTIVSCDIGSNVALSNVNYLSHFIIAGTVILININEMITTDHAKFGNGVIKDGEDEKVRIELELSNENGKRAVLPFDGMLPADAWIWSKYRDDRKLMENFKKITQSGFDSSRGYYGTVGEYSVIKNCRIVKDVKIGTHAYIKGCNKLKNLTINSSLQSSTQLGEGIELVNGIIGYGCRIFYGVKAIRFILADYSTLKYGARLLNSYLGANSTISCCEVLNSLIFPGHEQHHNNSFLCAATLKGQTNIASGATIGSNHNSRSNDGEIVAGRGFWPGLCTSLKHNSRFSSYNLLAKGDYPAEINNPLPFSLLSNDVTEGHLVIIPAYWFRYNLYALARNSWKYAVRDQRKVKLLQTEFDYLAPDTVNEMLTAMEYLEKLALDSDDFQGDRNNPSAFLISHPDISFSVGTIEKTDRRTLILKAGKAYELYRDFILYYLIKTIINYSITMEIPVESLFQEKTSREIDQWVNIGGQLVLESDVEDLRELIRTEKLTTWDEIHSKYSEYAGKYESDRLNHSLAVFYRLFGSGDIRSHLDDFRRICHFISQGTYNSRKKDYTDVFRMSTYDSINEMEEVVGKLEDNSFIRQIKDESAELVSLAEKYLV